MRGADNCNARFCKTVAKTKCRSNQVSIGCNRFKNSVASGTKKRGNVITRASIAV